MMDERLINPPWVIRENGEGYPITFPSLEAFKEHQAKLREEMAPYGGDEVVMPEALTEEQAIMLGDVINAAPQTAVQAAEFVYAALREILMGARARR